MLTQENRELFDRIWREAKGPPRLGFFATLNRLIDAARKEGPSRPPRETFTCTNCNSGPWDIGWDPHAQPVMRSGGGKICPNCSGAD